ncbi:MAG: glycosyltransferase involved in cell wall biosynthesis [Marivirga sp.]|jgi:glycosyltransferase involved in cell wall biosynthesis
MQSILASTYAVNPFKGSEDGMGWNMLLQIAKKHQVYAVTRENNQKNIEQFMAENPDDRYANLTFLYYDLPYWMRFWKKGGRGAMLYYWMWQRGIVSFIARQNISFDLVHNLNFHNDWTPSYLWKLGKPFVWGPIGHHPVIPAKYLKDYSSKIVWINRLTGSIKKAFWKLSRDLNRTAMAADHVLCMNSSVVKVLPQVRGKYSILPSVATQDFGYSASEKMGFKVISAGRLVALKGFDLTIKAFSVFIDQLSKSDADKAELVIVGSGPELINYQAMVKKLNISNKVRFIKWIERDDLMRLFKEASVFLFPSHEGAGMVVAEALSFGLPVVCLDNDGPGEFISEDCGYAIKAETYEATIAGLGNSLLELFADAAIYKSKSNAARRQFKNYFNWDLRADQLARIYQKLVS